MSYKVTVEGMESFEIAKECVRSVRFSTDIPLDSNARTKDVGSTLTLTGRILTAVDGDPFDSTRKLALWSAVPAEKAETLFPYTTLFRSSGAYCGRNYGAQILFPECVCRGLQRRLRRRGGNRNIYTGY